MGNIGLDSLTVQVAQSPVSPDPMLIAMQAMPLQAELLPDAR